MSSVVLGLSQEIKWPNYCVLCNKEATDWSLASSTSLKDFRYYVVALSWNRQSYKFSYPVCAQHKRICDFIDQPLQFYSILVSIMVGFFLWAIFILLFFLLFRFLGLENIAKDVIIPLSSVLAIGLVSAYYIYAIFFPSVVIEPLSEYSIKIFIRNEEYFYDFKLLNMDNVLE
jgi:hypothetical protein